MRDAKDLIEVQPDFLHLEEWCSINDHSYCECEIGSKVYDWWGWFESANIVDDPAMENKGHSFVLKLGCQIEDDWFECELCGRELGRRDDQPMHWGDIEICGEWDKPAPKPYACQTGQEVLAL